ncbi:AMP-binding protein (plasmid) [Pantoea agglomerans]|nr:AMP-binding protein [Pantoea agglomerans]MDK4218999.1 AMP-binding protein [Pantoea agglomerans]
MYGITETTVHVTEYTLTPESMTQGSVIGTALADLHVQVLDRYGEPVPAGVTGEMYVGGAGVTRLPGRAALTAQRFVPDPFGARGQGSTAPATARRRADGGLVYQGRADQQLKLRGYRIEPGEIEAALRAQAGVRDAAVVLDAPAQGQPRLVAYVVGGKGAQALREALSAALPEHMVPAVIMPLARLPLTAHGKLDRKALPEPEVTVSAGGEARTEVEKTLAGIWSEVLSIPAPGIDDNFFTLGGDSISSLQVVSRARAAGINITIEGFLAGQHIRKIAAGVQNGPVAADNESLTVPFGLLSAADRARLPDNVDDAFPLSRLQAGMLFHSTLAEEGAIFHDVFTFRLRMPWNEHAWRSAFELLPASHTPLRTSFHWTGYSEPLQVVHSTADIDYQIVDLRYLETEQRRHAVNDFIAQSKSYGFDPAKGRMFRVSLHRHTDEELQLTLDFHHAIFDGWSVATLLSTLIHRVTGTEKTNAHSDTTANTAFVALERKAEADEQLVVKWRERVADVVPTLLGDHSAAELSGTRQVQRRAFRLPDNLTSKLKQRATDLAIPLKIVLLTAHLSALAKVTGGTVTTTGYVTHGRPAGADKAVGLFLNTLPFSMALPPVSWNALIKSIAAEEQAIQAIRRLPASVIKPLNSSGQLYNVSFNYIHFHIYNSLPDLADFQVVDFEIFEETDFPLLAQYSQDPFDASLELTLVADPAIVPEWQVEQFGDFVLRAAEAIVSGSEAPWYSSLRSEALPLVPDASSELILDLCTQFEAAASRHADRVAITCEGESLTYAALDSAASALAWHLRGLGVGTGPHESLVGLSAGRGPGLLVGILGILKAGGAYVPLDPVYPAERLAFLAADSGIRLAVADDTGLAALAGLGVQTVSLSADHPRRAGNQAPPRSLHPQQAAYVIYTSGSTGQPKGCVVSHASVVRLFTATEHYGFGESDVWTLFHSYAFDFSVWEIWGALLHGGRLVVVPYLSSRDPERFAHLLEAESVTVLSQTPAAFRQLTAASAGRDFAALRLVLFGGEALEPGSLGAVVRAARRAGEAGQHVRHHRDHGARDRVHADAREHDAGQRDRHGAGGFARAGAGPLRRAGAGGRDGRDVRGRRGRDAGLPGPGSADGAALRAGSVRRAGGKALPLRRPGAPPGGRRPGVPGPGGPAAEAARLPHRAGRNRGGAAGAGGGTRRGGGAGRAGAGPAAAGGLRGGGQRGAGAARGAVGGAAGAHGARGHHAAGAAAADRARQARPEGPAGAGNCRGAERRRLSIQP